MALTKPGWDHQIGSLDHQIRSSDRITEKTQEKNIKY